MAINQERKEDTAMGYKVKGMIEEGLGEDELQALALLDVEVEAKALADDDDDDNGEL